MKKETLIAIIFGITLGVIVALLVVFQSKERQLSKSKPINNLTTTLTPKMDANAPPFFEISSPEDKVIVNGRTIKIKGKANKNSLIVIQSPIKELVFLNTEENFEKDFPLALGENVISLTNYPPDKHLSSVYKQLLVYYLDTQEKIE